MAKISANGDREVARWRSKSGQSQLLLTEQGRLLGRFLKGDSWTVRSRGVSLEQAERYAERQGFERILR